MPRPASFRLTLRRAAGMAALGALLVSPATAQAARPKAPVITSVAPLELAVGQTLTVRGRHFVKGRGKNTVVFKRTGGRAVFVKADLATAKTLRVTLPAKLEAALKVRDEEKLQTRFELRVLGRKLSKATPSRLSPTVAPAPPEEEQGDAPSPATPKPAATSAPAPLAPASTPLQALVEEAAAPAASSESSSPASAPQPCSLDDDLLDEATEKRLGLDPCKADTDGDGVEDGYELRSARDLNDDEYQDPQEYLPAPERRPYPNPLFSDSDVDYDGDTLTLAEEFGLWKLTVSRGAPRLLELLTYSDGEQYSLFARDSVTDQREPNQPVATYAKHADFLAWTVAEGYDMVQLQAVNDADPWDENADEWHEARTSYDFRDFDRSGGALSATEEAYFDHDRDGWVSDDERDEDSDGLTNYQEAHGCMVRKLWNGIYKSETAYYREFAVTDVDHADSDGDGVRDGLDDQDSDDVPNLMECSRRAAGGVPDARTATVPQAQPAKAWVNPFNPCLPAIKSRTCNDRPELDNAYAPFKPEEADKYFFVWN